MQYEFRLNNHNAFTKKEFEFLLNFYMPGIARGMSRKDFLRLLSEAQPYWDWFCCVVVVVLSVISSKKQKK